MAASEIADNKWEREASKPPVKTVGAFASILIIGSFAMVFLWIFSWSVRGMIGVDTKSLADKYGELNAEGKPPPPAPAESQ